MQLWNVEVEEESNCCRISTLKQERNTSLECESSEKVLTVGVLS